MKHMINVLLIAYVLNFSIAAAQTPITFTFTDPILTDGKSIKLEGFLYEPTVPNGKTILFSHGSTGGKRELISETVKFMRIGKLATDNGYRMITYMRKGRGASEGIFKEESGKCDKDSLNLEIADAYPQMDQVVEQIRKNYKVDKLILMGHSRGGFLSTLYAAKNPEKVFASVNFAGVWSAFCEMRNGGFSRGHLDLSAGKFKNLYWAYFENDSYFSVSTFNDPEYQWMANTAAKHGITFKKFPMGDMKDGHATATWRPEIWSDEIFKWLNAQR